MKPAMRIMMAERLAQAEAFLVRALRKTNYIGRRRLPPGVRSLVGVLCIIGGFLGFLPILGYWMVPVGILLIGLDIPSLRTPIARRISSWNQRVKEKAQNRD